MSVTLNKKQAYDLLCEYNFGEYHLLHGKIVGDVMRWFAVKLGYADEADFWETVGILHDLDFEKYPDEHCIKSREIMESLNLDPRLIRACVSHCWGINVDVKPEHEMEKVLYAADELTGLILAAAKVLPTQTVNDLELKSLKKKFKDKRFADGCSRDVIVSGAELLSWDLDKLFSLTIEAMRASENVI